MLIFSLIMYIMSIGVNLNEDKTILYSRCFLISLLGSLIISKNIIYSIFLDKGITLFGGLFFISYLNNMFNIFLLLICFIIGVITSFFPKKVIFEKYLSAYKLLSYNYNYDINRIDASNEQYKVIEYTLILLFIIIGGIFLMSSYDLISLFLSIELQSYGLYILSSIYRNSESSTSAGLTYFLLGSLSSCFILLSSSLLYANSGTTSLDNLYVISNISEDFKNISVVNMFDVFYWYDPYYIDFSLIILSIGLLFKVSAAPFHFWSPDVYDGVPTVVTTFISIIAKITIFIFLLQLVNNIYTSIYISYYTWTFNFVVSSLLSFVIGAVLGLTQTRIKRLLAYSSISHIGFILLVLSIKNMISTQAFLFYLIQYVISNLNIFIILILMGYTISNYIPNVPGEINNKEKGNSPIQLINQLKGYFYINPVLSLSLSITLFSFVGVPPLIGFFGKFMVLFAALNNGYIFMSIVAIITSVISGVYYLVIIKKIFFEKSYYKLNTVLTDFKLTCIINPFNFVINKNNLWHKATYYTRNDITLSSPLNILTSILTLIILFFIFISSELLNMTTLLSLYSYIN